MGRGEGKAWGKKIVLRKNEYGKNSGYIRWQAARAVKVVDGGRGAADEQHAKLLLLFVWFKLFLSLTNNRTREEHQLPEITEQRLHLPC